MIARLRGAPVALLDDGLVLDVGGVGYRLHATRSAIRAAEGASAVVLETHLHVRDDALQLFGFASPAERTLFEELLSVSGIGPKVALAIVSAFPPSDLRRAIVREDVALFTSIPGIGRKLAQRVVLELRERAAIEALPAADDPAAPDSHAIAREALVELGFSVGEAEQRLAATDDGLPADERVRLALRAA
jgi:Holliday junction DNA helicase RuvA